MIEQVRERVSLLTPQPDSTLTPAALKERAGLTPDPWQRALLESRAPRVLLLCSRQSGKSMATAAIVLAEALKSPGALLLVVCPAERQ